MGLRVDRFDHGAGSAGEAHVGVEGDLGFAGAELGLPVAGDGLYQGTDAGVGDRVAALLHCHRALGIEVHRAREQLEEPHVVRHDATAVAAFDEDRLAARVGRLELEVDAPGTTALSSA